MLPKYKSPLIQQLWPKRFGMATQIMPVCPDEDRADDIAPFHNLVLFDSARNIYSVSMCMGRNCHKIATLEGWERGGGGGGGNGSENIVFYIYIYIYYTDPTIFCED